MRFLASLAAAALGLASLAAPALAQTPVRVGIIPVLGVAPLLILQNEGWAKQAGLDLIEKTGLTQANASRHLQTLTQAGILGRRRDGTSVIYHITDPGIYRLCELVCGSLQTLLARHTSAFTSH